MKAQRLARGSDDRQKARTIARIVREHRGRANAIDMHEISRLTSIPTREVQTLVKILVEQHSQPIGTSTRRPFGYFWIATNDERREVRDHFVRRALSNLEHARAFDRDGIAAKYLGQLELDFGVDR
jgi:hypothetical protein